MTARERATVAVLGLGPLGAALAAALRQSGRYGSVTAWDPDLDVARDAQKHAVADHYAHRVADAAARAAALFVAVRPDQLRETLAAVGDAVQPGAVVCAVAQSHEEAMRLAAELLPPTASFACGHPVVWQAPEEAQAAGAAVFRGATFCLSPAPSAHPDAIGYLAGMAEELGMETLFLDPREHDALFGAVGQLPGLLAAVLLELLTAQPSWREMARLAGAVFREGTALVETEPARQQALLAAGREHLGRWLDALIERLEALREALREGREPADLFEHAAAARARWLRERRQPPEAADLPKLPELPKRRLLL